MPINKLTAGSKGNPFNSKGSEVAASVNALIDFSEEFEAGTAPIGVVTSQDVSDLVTGIAAGTANIAGANIDFGEIGGTASATGVELAEFTNQLLDKSDTVVSFIDSGASTAKSAAENTTAFQSLIDAGYKVIDLGDNNTFAVNNLSGGLSLTNFIGRNSKFTNGNYRVWDIDCYGKLRMPSSIIDFWPHAVYLNPDCTGATDLDVSSLKPAGQRYYVKKGGNNSNDGLTIATALADLATALGKPDVVEIVMIAGDYSFRGNAVGTLALPRDISISSLGGRVRIFGCDIDDFNVWTVNSTYPNVYQCNIASSSSNRQCWDSRYPDEHGYFYEYQKIAAGNLATLATTAGAYIYDGGVLYVNTLDGRVPDDDIRVWRSTDFIVTGAHTLYMEGIDWIGVQSFVVRDTTTANTPLFVGKNCTWGYSDAPGILGGGNFRTEGGRSILYKCKSYKGFLDGFNYHQYNTVLNAQWHVEIDCEGVDNGANGAGNNQGSTCHDGSKILRIGGYYARNEAANIEDVSAGSVSYNVGCVLDNSSRLTAPRQYLIGSGCQGYLVGVKFRGRTGNDAQVFGATAMLYHYKTGVSNYSGDVTRIQQFNPLLNP